MRKRSDRELREVRSDQVKRVKKKRITKKGKLTIKNYKSKNADREGNGRVYSGVLSNTLNIA